MSKEVDMVSHPPHYEGSTSLECIQAMRLAFGDIGVAYFCLCNAFKYMWRYKNKNGEEDIKKAIWYKDYVSNMMSTHDMESTRIREMYDRIDNLLYEIKSNTYGV